MTQQKSGYPLDYSQGAKSTKDRMGKLTEDVGDQFNRASQSAQDMAAQVAERAQEYGEMAQDAAKKFKPYVEQSLKEKPVATLAAAAAIAFVLGALWKR